MENSKTKILAIDDNLDNLITLKAMIKDAFPEAITLTALNGVSGIDLAAKENPDVILLDIVMPEMDGFEVCLKLKSNSILCDIPIIFITAIKGDKESRIRALECGAEAFIAKPIDESELTAQIRSMLKIKTANNYKRNENVRLAALIAERTKELEETHNATLLLLDKLQLSEIRFKQVSEDAQEWIWEVDINGLFTYSSPVVESLLGYKTEEIIGLKYFYDLFPPDKKFHLKENAFKMFSNKASFKNFYNPNLHKDGHVVILESSGSPILDNDGSLIGYRGIDFDSTARVQAENKLKESNALMRIAGKSAKLGGWNVNLEKTLLYWSDEVAAIHEMPPGYTPTVEESLNYYAPEWRDRIIKVFTDCAQSGIPYDEEMEIITKSGKRVWIRTIGEAVKDNNGKIVKVQGAFQDISELKIAEEKVRQKDIQFRKLSSNVSDMIFQFCRKPEGTYYVPIASEGIRNIFGCTPEDVLEDFSPISRVIYPEDVARVISDIEFSAKHLTYFTCEFRVQIPGKPIQWIYSKSTPEKLPDGSIVWYGFNADISERFQSQQELIKAKEKAEENNRLKTAFLANLSHEIRTPLNSILGFAEMLNEPHISPEELKEYASFIDKGGKRMLSIINDLIDISKIESGLLEVYLSNFNLNEQIDDIYGFFKQEAEQKKINISLIKGLTDNESVIHSDKDKLNAVLINLVKNALKFSHEGRIEISYEKREGFLEFCVSDSGIGIQPEHQKIIFDRFRQANETITRDFEGSGLGLSISKAYIELLNGKIWVESEFGKGSRFCFTIPYAQIEY